MPQNVILSHFWGMKIFEEGGDNSIAAPCMFHNESCTEIFRALLDWRLSILLKMSDEACIFEQWSRILSNSIVLCCNLCSVQIQIRHTAIIPNNTLAFNRFEGTSYHQDPKQCIFLTEKCSDFDQFAHTRMELKAWRGCVVASLKQHTQGKNVKKSVFYRKYFMNALKPVIRIKFWNVGNPSFPIVFWHFGSLYWYDFNQYTWTIFFLFWPSVQQQQYLPVLLWVFAQPVRFLHIPILIEHQNMMRHSQAFEWIKVHKDYRRHTLVLLMHFYAYKCSKSH